MDGAPRSLKPSVAGRPSARDHQLGRIDLSDQRAFALSNFRTLELPSSPALRLQGEEEFAAGQTNCGAREL